MGAGTGDHPSRAVVETHFAADRKSVMAARTIVGDRLREEGYDELTIDVACLVTSELATNAVMHAETEFDVRCVVNGDVRIEVADLRADSDVTPQRPSATELVGRGLAIVTDSSTRWGVERDERGKTVWCELASSLSPT